MSKRSVGLKVELRALETRMRLQVFDALKNLLRSEAAGVGMRRARSSEERVRRSGSKERSRRPGLKGSEGPSCLSEVTCGVTILVTIQEANASKFHCEYSLTASFCKAGQHSWRGGFKAGEAWPKAYSRTSFRFLWTKYFCTVEEREP